MAIDAHSTTAPAFQRALLRDARLLTGSILAAVPLPTPALTAETIALLDAIPDVAEISATVISQGEAAELRVPPLIHDTIVGSPDIEPDVPHDGVPIDGGPALKSEHTLFPNFGENPVAPSLAQTGELSALDPATVRHMRRALEGALDHGAALLAALGLPQLVDDGFAPLDPVAAGDAVHRAIATLDALDAPDMDLEDGGDAEPSLGWIDGKPTLSDSHDDREAEADDEPMLGAPERSPQSGPWGPPRDSSGSQIDWADGSTRHDEAEAVNEDGGDILDEGEETLGWAANVGQLALGMTTADGDETALERHGKGFVRSGGDDSEDSDPSGGQQHDEEALFWSLDVGCAIGAPVDGDGAHG